MWAAGRLENNVCNLSSTGGPVQAVEEQNRSPRFEQRWPVVLTTAVVMFLLRMMPDRIRLFPTWAPCVPWAVVIVPMAAVGLTGAKSRWLRIERVATFVFFVVAAVGTIVNLVALIHEMLQGTEGVNGVQLLASSIGVWVTNVLMFSLLYWQMDRGGPEARINNIGKKPDWHFPQNEFPEEVATDWRPMFVDYLFLAFNTTTAFSPTEAVPLTSRAKILMMLESTISLVTIVLVASRAINILGS